MSVVTFDLWHTLLYLPPDQEERYMRHQVELATEALRSAPALPGAPSLGVEELSRAFRHEYDAAVAEASRGISVTPREQLERAARECGRSPDVDGYLRSLRTLVEELPLLRAPGAIELLEGLRSDGLSLALLSNTIGEPGDYLRPALERLGLRAFFPVIVFSDEHPWTKPAPEIFLEALRRLGASPGEAVHVGDGWSDLEGARRAGYRAGILFEGLGDYGETYRKLFAARPAGGLEAAYRARTLEEVRGLVRRILGGRRA